MYSVRPTQILHVHPQIRRIEVKLYAKAFSNQDKHGCFVQIFSLFNLQCCRVNILAYMHIILLLQRSVADMK